MPFVRASDLKKRSIEFLWDQRFAIGKPTLVTGKSLAGKSTLLTAVAASLTRGEAMPGGPRLLPGNVVWLCAEEQPEDCILARLEANNADLKRVFFPGFNRDGQVKFRPRFPGDNDKLLDFMLSVECRLLVIDPIGSFLTVGFGEDNGFTAREVTQSLTDLCQKARCGCGFVKHPRKGSAGNGTDQVSGSKEWFNQPRSVLVVGFHPNADDLRVVASLKCSFGPTPNSYTFGIDGANDSACLRFVGTSEFTADDVFAGQGDAVERSMLQLAKEFIKDRMDSGWELAVTILSAAASIGLNTKTLYRAKKELGVTSKPVGSNENRHHIWEKPSGGWPKGV